MERRGLKSTGFPEIDKDILQRAFNDEFAVKAEEERAKIKERKRRQAQQAGLQRRRMQMEQTLQEEQDELAKSHQVGMMIELIKDDAVASSIRIDVNSVSARSLAKVMWVNTCITCLDLSSNKLDDHAGAYIARILTRNKTLKKMELDNNEFGQKTLAAFGESLRINESLVYLNVDSNPMFTNDDLKGARFFAEALRANTTLVSLNLWRTGMKAADGELLASALDHNHVLLFVDIGHNGVKMREMKRMADKLDKNLAAYERAERIRREDALTDEQRQKKLQDELDAIQKDKELKEWYVFCFCSLLYTIALHILGPFLVSSYLYLPYLTILYPGWKHDENNVQNPNDKKKKNGLLKHNVLLKRKENYYMNKPKENEKKRKKQQQKKLPKEKKEKNK